MSELIQIFNFTALCSCLSLCRRQDKGSWRHFLRDDISLPIGNFHTTDQVGSGWLTGALFLIVKSALGKTPKSQMVGKICGWGESNYSAIAIGF